MKLFYTNRINAIIVIAMIIFFNTAASAQSLSFTNYTLVSGTAAANGAVYRFANIVTGVDALVEIKGRSGSDVILSNIDVTEYGKDKAFQPQVHRTGNSVGLADWWMEFEVRFVKGGTTQDANLIKLNIKALDIDGDALKVQEYVEFYKAKSCTLAAISLLSAIPLNGNNETATGDKNYRFKSALSYYPFIDTVETSIMGFTRYENMNRIKIRTGGETLGLPGTGDNERYYSLWFDSYQFQATLPVNLVSFNAALVNKNVALTWTTAQEKNASHFTVQRSSDGVEFTDAGIIFTDGNSEMARSYNFKDPMSTNGKGILYYRLKVVDLDGKFEYSQIRIIKLGDNKGKLELTTFPNPVVNELRITIPESWQSRQVVYEVYTGDGQLMKRFLNKSATQTEIINMQFYVPGTYIIKALNDKEIATQRVVKRK